jgi:hypothetical protein
MAAFVLDCGAWGQFYTGAVGQRAHPSRIKPVLGAAGNRCRDLVVAMIVARLIAPISKLATAKALDPALMEKCVLKAKDQRGCKDPLFVLPWTTSSEGER